MKWMMLLTVALMLSCAHRTRVVSEPGASVSINERVVGVAPLSYDDDDYDGEVVAIRVSTPDGRAAETAVVRQSEVDWAAWSLVPLGALMVAGYVAAWVWWVDEFNALSRLPADSEERFSAGEAHSQACVLLGSVGLLCPATGGWLMARPITDPRYRGPDEVMLALPDAAGQRF